MPDNISHSNWTKHAPPGGITINGKFYKGGRFIPNEEFEKASPEEKNNLINKLTNRGNISPKKPMDIPNEDNSTPDNSVLPTQLPQGDAVQEPFYIIDNGELLGQANSSLGYFILRNNPVQEPVIFPKELKLLSALNTYRFDLISPATNKVYSLISETRIWPETKLVGNNNIFNELANDKNIKSSVANLSTYKITNNLSPQIKDIFNTVQKMNLIRLSRLSENKELYLVQDEKDNSNKILRLHNSSEHRDTYLFVNKLYKKLGIPVTNVEPNKYNKQESLSSIEKIDETPANPLKKLLQGWLIDVLIGNHDPCGHNNHHILTINGEATRSHFPDEIPEVDELLEHKVDDYKDRYTQDDELNESNNTITTQDLIDNARNVISKINYRVLDEIMDEMSIAPDLRNRIKDLLLRRLEILRTQLTTAEHLSLRKPVEKTSRQLTNDRISKLKRLLTK